MRSTTVFFVGLIVVNLVLVEIGVFARRRGRVLPPGYEYVDGEAIDVTDKVIQLTTPSATQYYSFANPNGKPLYIRESYERGWHFIVFDDPYNKDPGGGHLIVLQRMSGLSADRTGKIIYEAFLLSLEESIAADVERYDVKEADYYRDEDATSAKKDAHFIKAEARRSGVIGQRGFENGPGLPLPRQKRNLEIDKDLSLENCELMPMEFPS